MSGVERRVTEVFRFVFGAIASLLTLYGLAYVLALSRPLLFYEQFASRGDTSSKVRSVLTYALLVLKIISVGFFFYYAAYGIFDVIPRRWMEYDQDGDVITSTRQYLQIFAAVVATAFALDSESKVAREGRRLLQERQNEHGY